MNEDLTYLRTLDPDAFEDMPSRRLEALRPLLGRIIETIQLNAEIFLYDPDLGLTYRSQTRREKLLEFLGDTLITVSGGGGVRVSVSEPLQSLTLHPPTALRPAGLDEDGDRHELIDVAEFPDWRPLLGRRIEGIDIIIGNCERKYGTGVLERGLRFRLEGGLSFIAAVWSEANALWLPGEIPEKWRREIHSITPIA